MGDYPLKDRNLITCEPDVLSFDLVCSNADVAVLATDGLWDVVTNEDSVEVARGESAAPHARAQRLAELAYDKDSLDNVTVAVMDLAKLARLTTQKT